ncbi:BREX-1 system adenine-specific DNA-methyltransferase PglX [Slackia heliotrinireducens]|uniref:BREX-1 system adenine-specific DNA-methyltransferase PglX n=1 Tax=Slackia heliotrinireducens TaxID=84110 RepID=UPI003314FF5A
MNENAIKSYATWARRELIAEVERRCAMYGITVAKDCPLDIDSVEGRVLTSLERKQRRELVAMARNDMDALVERAAYTWFNRILAIRFMECNDRLPSQTRMFSAADGSFSPQVLREALSVEIGGIDRPHVASLLQSGDDEALFRYLFLLQCDELAACMPSVFGKMERDPLTLLLPDGLLRPEGVIGRIVADIDEADWRDGVQIVGWMYQFYMADVRAELQDVRVGKRQIATATQVYTSEWIVRYMIENSIGRLWVLNHANSPLKEQMQYYVSSDETNYCTINSPEEITVMDPACGSGHILVCAFDLLVNIYTEAGYSAREAARCIVEKNLYGLEIDERAAALASFSIMMKACEIDSRFLRRGVLPNVKTLESIEFEVEELELCHDLARKHRLLDSLAHLDICGSLFKPTVDEIELLNHELEKIKDDQSLFAMGATMKIEKALDLISTLSDNWMVVAANPPYRSSAKMDSWMSAWLRGEYPEEKADLFSAFIWRLANSRIAGGVMSIAASNSWMFISTFEAARRKILEKLDIATLVQLSVHGYKGIAAQVFLFTCVEKQGDGYCGGYIRLDDFDHHSLQGPKTIEAIANQKSYWFYRTNTETLKPIPGWPIAYWASANMIRCFSSLKPLSEIARPRQGLVTGDNDRFLRMWWEVSFDRIGFGFSSREEACKSGMKWFPCNKGGEFQKMVRE